jgi:CTP:molybdopterin cytidylyltransferase MocA
MNSAVIVAAGLSTRYKMSGGTGNKMDILLKGKPLYYHSMKVFLEMGFEVILVTNKDINIYFIFLKKISNNIILNCLR